MESYRETLLWILDRTGSRPGLDWDEEAVRSRIGFVHSLGLKCDSVGWCELDLDRPDSGAILAAVDAFCRDGGWTARGWYRREYVPTSAAWYSLGGRSFRSDEVPGVEDTALCLPRIRACAVSGSGPWRWAGYHCVSDRFRTFWEAGGGSGLRFCWLKDVGRCRAEQIFAIAPDEIIPYTVKQHFLCEAAPQRLRESPAYERLLALGAWLPRLAELFTELHVTLPLCCRTEDLPVGGLGYTYLPQTRSEAGQSEILLRADLAEGLIGRRLLRRTDLQAVIVCDEPLPGYERRTCVPRPFPDENALAERMTACAALLSRDRPEREVREQDAQRLLRQARRARPGDFGKAMSKKRREELLATDFAPLVPYYGVCEGGLLSEEYELLGFDAARTETERFREELRAEELVTEDLAGSVIARCADGDRVILASNGHVLRVSHEAPTAEADWHSLPLFLTEALAES